MTVGRLSGLLGPRFSRMPPPGCSGCAAVSQITLTSQVINRHGKPIAQLVPLDPSPRRQLGFLKGSVEDAFFEPLPDDELQRWG